RYFAAPISSAGNRYGNAHQPTITNVISIIGRPKDRLTDVTDFRIGANWGAALLTGFDHRAVLRCGRFLRETRGKADCIQFCWPRVTKLPSAPKCFQSCTPLCFRRPEAWIRPRHASFP